MRLARRIAVLFILVACLWLLPTTSRAQCSEACGECKSNAENYYFTCSTWCDVGGHGWWCGYRCYTDYQQQLELCESL